MRAGVLFLLLFAAIELRGAVLYRVKLSVNEGGRVVEIDSERYTAGVIAAEAGVLESPEALKAVGVAARTYAAFMRGRHTAEGYDFCSTTHCQRFEEKGATPKFLAMARATEGEMLWYRGRPALTVYSRDCGGTAEAASAVWPQVEAPYLRVKSDPYCLRRGGNAWTWSVTLTQLDGALRNAGLRVPARLASAAILSRTESGRARLLALEGAAGTQTLAEGSFRLAIGRALGWAGLRSDLYQLRGASGTLSFTGRGEGHGVGLCQRGADQMGREGRTYREIAAFYFPGTEMSRTGAGLRWTRLGGERVVVFSESPPQDRGIVRIAERCLAAVEQHLGRTVTSAIQVYVYPDLDSFRNSTGEPGWVAAHTRGLTIDLQPRELLAAKGGLRAAVCHEITHAAIESWARPGTPLWFREGLTGWVNGEAEGKAGSIISDIELRQRADFTTARQAAANAVERFAELIRRYGEGTVVGWLSAGLPPDAIRASARVAAMQSK